MPARRPLSREQAQAAAQWRSCAQRTIGYSRIMNRRRMCFCIAIGLVCTRLLTNERSDPPLPERYRLHTRPLGGMGKRTHAVFITYGNSVFHRRAKLLGHEAWQTGAFDSVWACDEGCMTDNFRSTYASVLLQRQGGGFWLWKPYIMRRLLDMGPRAVVPDGAGTSKTLSSWFQADKTTAGTAPLLVYADAGCTFNISNMARLFELFKMTRECPTGVLRYKLV